MTAFVALALLLLAASLWPLLGSLNGRRSPRPHSVQASAAPVALLREQHARIEAEHRAGQIDETAYARAQADLARRVLEASAQAEPPDQTAYRLVTAGVLLLGVPLLATALYLHLGQPQAVQTEAQRISASPQATLADVDAMVRQMAQALENPPAGQAPDPNAWAMLARTQAGLQRWADADRSLQRALALQPDQVDWLADRADILGLVGTPGAPVEAARLVARALQLNPDHPKALALAGGAAWERQDMAVAEAHWRRARSQVADGSAFAANLDRSLQAVAERRGAIASPAVPLAAVVATAGPAAATTAAPAAAPPAVLMGRIELAAALQGRLQPGDTLFITARAAPSPSAGGAPASRMPLAVIRRPATAQASDFRLDDSLAMAAGHSLSSHFAQKTPVVVEARISRSGQALPQPGDLLGRSAAFTASAQGVRVLIDRVQP